VKERTISMKKILKTRDAQAVELANESEDVVKTTIDDERDSAQANAEERHAHVGFCVHVNVVFGVTSESRRIIIALWSGFVP